MKQFDAIVIGAGAAGLMCAWQAAARGFKVALLERSKRPGRKILMSGGGRCNFTNMDVQPSNYLCQNPHFVKSALKQYGQWDFIAKVIEHGIPYHEREHGQLFCDDSAKDINEMLLAECRNAGVELFTKCETTSVEYNDGLYTLQTNTGEFSATNLVVATGGLSIPSMGVGDFGYALATQFDLKLLPTSAGLVPFTFTDKLGEAFARLSGTAIDARIELGKTNFREALLFTHRGLSGPVCLQISNYWKSGDNISIDLLPDEDMAVSLIDLKSSKPKSLLRTLLSQLLPKALVSELETLWWPDNKDTPLSEFTNNALIEIGRQLNQWVVKPSGTEGYRTAEVTLGGLDTDCLSSKTMEVKTQAGLHFIGEAVDVTGHLGGFNFQWAWSSAYACAQHLNKT